VEEPNSTKLPRNQGKKTKIEMQGEFKKISSLTHDRELEEAAEAWLLNINRYFQVYDCSNNLKAKLAIFQL